MARAAPLALALMTVCSVVQANQCSSDSACPSNNELPNGVLLLQSKLQMNVLQPANNGSEADEQAVNPEGAHQQAASGSEGHVHNPEGVDQQPANNGSEADDDAVLPKQYEAYQEVSKEGTVINQENDCTFELVMLDNRALPSKINLDKYWGMTAVINHAYAQKFNYTFRLVRPEQNNKTYFWPPEWFRPLYFADRLREVSGSTRCKWFLYLDSDAFVRNFDLPLEEFIPGLTSKYNIPNDVAAVFAQERAIPGVFEPADSWLNAGVFLVQENGRSRSFFNAWIEAGRNENTSARTQWPREQGTLTHLFRNSHDIKNMLGVVDMLEMNSPDGKFVEHIWGGWGKEKRLTDYTEMLEQIDAKDPEKFSKSLRQVAMCTVSWTPTPL